MGEPDAGPSLPDNGSVVSHRDRPATQHQPGALLYSLDAAERPVTANPRSTDPGFGGYGPRASRGAAGVGGVRRWGVGRVPVDYRAAGVGAGGRSLARPALWR